MNYFHELASTAARLPVLAAPLLDFVRRCEGTLWLAGNGGSASTAQHWACDLSKAAGRRVVALGSNPAVLTAWANDEGYADALAEELKRLAQPGDALVCLSCSGTSLNISVVLHTAKQIEMPAALVTGTMWPNGRPNWIKADPVDVVVSVPHDHYGIIEDCHLAIGHWLTEELR